MCAALDGTGIAGHPEEHFEVLLETGQRRQPRDYFQRSNDPEVWALLDDPGVQGRSGRVRWQVRRASGAKGPLLEPARLPDAGREGARARARPRTACLGPRSCGPTSGTSFAWRAGGDCRTCVPARCPPPCCPTCGGSSGCVAGTPPVRPSRCGRRSRPSSGARTPTRTSGGGVCASALPPIDHLKLRIDEHNAAWQDFFEGCGVEPMEVVYEELVEDYEGTVLWLLDGIGVPVPGDFRRRRA